MVITINPEKKALIGAAKNQTGPLPTETVLQSPNGTPFAITVDDTGKITTEPLGAGFNAEMGA